MDREQIQFLHRYKSRLIQQVYRWIETIRSQIPMMSLSLDLYT